MLLSVLKGNDYLPKVRDFKDCFKDYVQIIRKKAGVEPLESWGIINEQEVVLTT